MKTALQNVNSHILNLLWKKAKSFEFDYTPSPSATNSSCQASTRSQRSGMAA